MSTEAMKQALEALEKYFSSASFSEQEESEDDLLEARKVLRQAIEQAQKQEPVVWMYQDKSTHEVRFQKHMRDFVDHGQTYETPLYTSPPQRQPLSDDEIDEIWNRYCDELGEASINDAYDIARAIEAAHGIKGEA